MSDPLKEFLDKIRAAVPKRDWPRVSREMGVKYGTLRNVMRGANPKEPTRLKMVAWYERWRLAHCMDELNESAIASGRSMLENPNPRVGPSGVGVPTMSSPWMIPVVPVTAAKQSLYFMMLFALNTLDDDQVRQIENEIGERLTKWRRRHNEPIK